MRILLVAAVLSIFWPVPLGAADAETADGAQEKRIADFANELFRDMLDLQTNVSAKQLSILEARRRGDIVSETFYLGGLFQGLAIWEKTNTAGKFPILSRLPGQHEGTVDRQLFIDNAAVAANVSIGDWVTGYIQGNYIDTRYDDQSKYQIRKAYVALGDLNQFPVYAYFGRNTVDFGNFASFNPYTHSISTHFFWTLSEDAVIGLGYADHGWHVIGTLIPGGRHRRVADADGGGYTDNFAVAATKEFVLSDRFKVIGGAGYLHRTSYNTPLPHHVPVGIAGQFRSENPAVNAHLLMAYENLELMAEYTTTLEDWPATNHLVSAFTLQGRYSIPIRSYRLLLSAVYSRGIFGPRGSEFEFMDQAILGAEFQLNDHAALGLEYVHNRGFAPLIAITQAADQSVKTDTVIAGVRLSF